MTASRACILSDSECLFGRDSFLTPWLRSVLLEQILERFLEVDTHRGHDPIRRCLGRAVLERLAAAKRRISLRPCGAWSLRRRIEGASQRNVLLHSLQILQQRSLLGRGEPLQQQRFPRTRHVYDL